MQKDVAKLFGRLGLKEREGRIYLTCLRASDGQFTHEIVKSTRITRSTVDITLQRLVARGFITRVKVGRRYRFMAQKPDIILARQKQLVEDFEKALPFLNLTGGRPKEHEVIYFEGRQGLREVHEDVLLTVKLAKGDKKHICAIASGEDSIRLFPDMQKAFIDKRVRNQSWYRAIASVASAKVPEYRTDPLALREVRYVADPDFLVQIEMGAGVAKRT